MAGNTALTYAEIEKLKNEIQSGSQAMSSQLRTLINAISAVESAWTGQGAQRLQAGPERPQRGPRRPAPHARRHQRRHQPQTGTTSHVQRLRGASPASAASTSTAVRPAASSTRAPPAASATTRAPPTVGEQASDGGMATVHTQSATSSGGEHGRQRGPSGDIRRGGARPPPTSSVPPRNCKPSSTRSGARSSRVSDSWEGEAHQAFQAAERQWNSSREPHPEHAARGRHQDPFRQRGLPGNGPSGCWVLPVALWMPSLGVDATDFGVHPIAPF